MGPQTTRNSALRRFPCPEEQSTISRLGTSLKQPSSRGGIPQHTREPFQDAKKGFGSRGLLIHDLIETTNETIISLAQITRFTNALVESVPKHRREAFESLPEKVRVSPKSKYSLPGGQT